MRQYFQDKDVDANFHEKGFVVIDLFNEEEVQFLLKSYNGLKKQSGSKLQFSYNIDAVHKVKEIENDVNNYCRDKILNYFKDCYLYGSCFITKKPGLKNSVAFHQDWSMTDESSDYAFLIWCPLVNITSRNGGFYVLPQSHKLNTGIRSKNIPTAFFSIDSLKGFSERVELSAGQAIIYLPQLFHGTKSNHTFKNRTVAFFTVLPKESEVAYFFNSPGANQMNVFKLPENFHHQYESVVVNDQHSGLTLLKTFPFKKINVDIDLIKSTLKQQLL